MKIKVPVPHSYLDDADPVLIADGHPQPGYRPDELPHWDGIHDQIFDLLGGSESIPEVFTVIVGKNQTMDEIEIPGDDFPVVSDKLRMARTVQFDWIRRGKWWRCLLYFSVEPRDDNTVLHVEVDDLERGDA